MIVVGVDGSDCGRRALFWALEDAALVGDAVTVVRAWPGGAHPRREGERAELEREVAAALRELPHPPEAVPMLVEGDPATALLDVAHDTGAGTIVVGRVGMGLIADLVLGSVSRRCARVADRTVVLVPPEPGESARRVVVGVDDAPECVDALRWAAAEAAARRSALVAVHAYEGIAWGNDAATAAVARERLDRVLAKAGVDGAERVVVEDDVLPALLREPSDLLVLGGLPRGLLSLTVAVPVAVVREEWRQR